MTRTAQIAFLDVTYAPGAAGVACLLADTWTTATSAPAQRFYNLLCTAYGSDQTRYGDFLEKGYLPKSRSGSCMREFNTTAFAFRELISPHVDKELATQVLGKTWLPDSRRPLPQN